MFVLRLYLLTGLVVHKLVWEILKRRQTSPRTRPATVPPTSAHTTPQLLLVKTVKVAILLGIAAQTFLPEIFPISGEPFALRLFGTLVYTAGLAIAIRSRTELGTNWSDIEAAEVFGEHKIVSNGPYRYIRHPIYIGDLLLLTGLELALNSWLVLGVLVLAPLVLRQAVKEEKKLASTLPHYQAYCSQTKRFIPFVV